MFNFGFGELLVILVLALIIFGPGKLPQVGAALGKGISEFKKAARGLQDDLSHEEEPPARGAEPRKETGSPGEPGGGGAGPQG